MTRGPTLLATAFAMLASATAGAAEPLRATFGEASCTPAESWTFSPAIDQEKRADFTDALKGKMAPVRGFSEALAMRRFADNDETRYLGEYWISRSLHDAKLVHIAFNGFATIAARAVKADTAGIQLASLRCMAEIQAKYPTLELPDSVTERLADLGAHLKTPAMRESMWLVASSALRSRLPKLPLPRRGAVPPKDDKVEAFMALLKGSGPYEDFAAALRAAQANDHNTAIRRMDAFFALPALPAPLKRYVNSARILLARELYAMQQFDRAAAQLKLVTKDSNELSTALEELAWAFLMNDRLSEAIGTAMNLNAGGMRHTYAPEAPMVMAMALNELCQFPESVRAINLFRRSYEKSFQWLQINLAGKGSEKFYTEAIQFVRRAPGVKVPDRVASEWVRSPLFLASQDELNLLFDENEATVALGRSGAKEQAKIADAALRRAKDLPQRLRSAKAKLKSVDDHLPAPLLADLKALKDMVVSYGRMQQGAPVWHAILKNYQKSVPTTEKRLVGTINADLKARSQRMLAHLQEIAENIQLIEVEIYNGASQDIIWQNAHPDYKKVAQSLKEERTGDNGGFHSLDWGRASADEEGGEVWEDELGSFNANLYDNCSSKDKYLALKAGRLASKE